MRLDVEAHQYELNRNLQDFRRVVVRKVYGAPIVPTSEVILMYNGRKRTVYSNARESLGKCPINQKDARLCAFVKFEKQDINKAPRIILPRSSRYNLRLAKYLKGAEKRYFKGINDAFGARTRSTVIKGFNNCKVANILWDKWCEFLNPVAVGLDAKKFDMHVTPEALKWEHTFYNRVFRSPELRKLLRWQLRNEGVAYANDGRVKFRMEGTRCSGDMNTSLGNCIIMCGLIYAYSSERGVRVELANNGDDCVVIMERRDLDRYTHNLSEWFEEYGFRMTVEPPVQVFEQIEFCQTHPVMTVEGWKMMRNFPAVMRKDGICLMEVQNMKVLRKWMGGVGACNLAAHCGVPVLQQMALWFIEHGTSCPTKMLERMFENTSMLERIRKLEGKKLDVNSIARASFFWATGVVPQLQMEMEQYFKNLKFDATQVFAGQEESACENSKLPCFMSYCIETPALI